CRLGKISMAAATTALKIRTALAEYLKRDVASITDAHHLRDDLGLDSMAVIELLYRIEDTFDIQIPDQDLAGLTTVWHVITYVNKGLGGTPTAGVSNKPSKSTSKKRSYPIHGCSSSADPHLSHPNPSGDGRRARWLPRCVHHKPGEPQ